MSETPTEPVAAEPVATEPMITEVLATEVLATRPVATEALPAVEKHLEAVASAQRPFTVHLRGTGTFRPVTEVVFVTLAAGISECELLAEAISGA